MLGRRWPTASSRLGSAYRHAGVARARIDDARGRARPGWASSTPSRWCPPELRQRRRGAGARARVDQRRRRRPSPTSTPGCRAVHGARAAAAGADHRGVRRAVRRGRARARRGRAGRATPRCAPTPRRWSRCGCASDGLDAARADPGCAGCCTNPRLARPGRAGRGRPGRGVPAVARSRTRPSWPSCVADAAPGAAGREPDALARPGRQGRRRRPGSRSCGRSAPAGSGGGPSRGFPVAVPLLDESHLQISSTPDSRATAEALVRDPAAAGGQLLPARPGAAARLGRRAVHRDAARALPAHPHRAAHRARPEPAAAAARGAVRPDPAGAHPGAGRRAPVAARAGRDRPADAAEPWVVAVLVGNRSALRDEDHRQLQRVARGGLACGVQLVLLDVPMTVNAPVETVHVARRRHGRHVDDRPVRHRARWTRRCRAGEVTARLPRDRRRARALAQPDRHLRRPAARRATSGAAQQSRQRAARPGRVRRRAAGRDDAGRRLPARADRRPERLGQDQPAAHHDQLDGRPLRPGRAGVLPARLQGGGVVRAVRPRPPGPARGCRTPG